MPTLTNHRARRSLVASIRLRLVWCGLILAATTLTTATPTHAQLSSPLPILLTDVNGSWIEGRSQWVALTWTSQRDLENVQVRGTSPDPHVSVGYPASTLDHATLGNGPQLSTNEVDSTMVFVSTTTATPASWQLDLTVSWEAGGTTQLGSATIWFESLSIDPDAPFLAVTDAVTVPGDGDGTRNWAEIDYLGVTAVVGDFEVSLEGDLPVHYPQELFASLHHDSVLNPDEIDTARVWFDPQRIEPGVYDMTVTVEYIVPGDRSTRTASHPLTVTVI